MKPSDIFSVCLIAIITSIVVSSMVYFGFFIFDKVVVDTFWESGAMVIGLCGWLIVAGMLLFDGIPEIFAYIAHAFERADEEWEEMKKKEDSRGD